MMVLGAVATAGVNNRNRARLPCHTSRLCDTIVIDTIVAESGLRRDALEMVMARAFACMTEVLGECKMRCR